ncbi:MAG TPA: GAF domain-containing protein [Candidatus Eisenbacteria bacterium]|nr:GAF domain-containing protein [Candidatus Eisenbacteria bacterium]
MSDPAPILKRLREILAVPGDRVGKARRIAAAIRETGGYRWVGVYDVAPDEIGVVAWSGPSAPAYPRFAVGLGLCGASVRSRTTVVVGDVTRDPRYLTTLGTTRSEIVAPVLDPASGVVVGLLDVESERVDAFNAEDRRCLEECASALAPLWG